MRCFAMALTQFTMEFSDVDTGGLISFVADLVWFDASHEGHLLKVVHNGRLCRLRGLLEGHWMRMTVLNVVVEKQFPEPFLCCNEGTKFLYHSPHSWDDMFKVIDLCCGIGGISHGAASAGFHTTVACDQNSKMTALHSAHATCEHVTGDIGNPLVVAAIWKFADHAAVLSSGFSCQPFSSLGD